MYHSVPTSLSISGHRGEKATLGDHAGEDCFLNSHTTSTTSRFFTHYPPLLGVIHAPQLVVCDNARQKHDLFPPSQPASPACCHLQRRTSSCLSSHTFADSVFRVLLCRKETGPGFLYAFFARMHELRKSESTSGRVHVLVGIRFGSFPSAESALGKLLLHSC